MEQSIQDFMQLKRIAVAGVSRGGKKFGNTIYSDLKAKGYQVYVVHPEMKEYDGQPCYPNPAALKDKVDGLVICTPPAQNARLIAEANQAGIRRLWLQMGADTPALVQQAKDLGMSVTAGKCILLYAEPVTSIHSWHKFFAKLFGAL
jgi:predicted CoA-binding protein